MSPRELALDWRVDGSTGLAFLTLVGIVGVAYLAAAKHGERRDRRGRRWPRWRSGCFLAGLFVLTVDLYSGIGTEADVRLSVHMIEHMVMWVLVAPLLVAGAPVRLAFYSMSRRGRRARSRDACGLAPSLPSPARSSASVCFPPPCLALICPRYTVWR